MAVMGSNWRDISDWDHPSSEANEFYKRRFSNAHNRYEDKVGYDGVPYNQWVQTRSDIPEPIKIKCEGLCLPVNYDIDDVTFILINKNEHLPTLRIMIPNLQYRYECRLSEMLEGQAASYFLRCVESRPKSLQSLLMNIMELLINDGKVISQMQELI